MNIQSIQNNNTNFRGLHVDKKIYRQLGIGHSKDIFLRNPAIKECADKFEVMVEKGKPIAREKGEPFSKFLLQFGAGSIGTGIAMITAVLSYQAAGMLFTPLTLMGWGAIGAAIGYIGATGCILHREHGNDYEYNLQVGKKVNDSMFGKQQLLTPLSRKYPIRKYEDIQKITNIADIAQQNDEQNFMDIVENYNINDLYEPKNILKILQNKTIKQYYSNGECFNYKLQDGSEDTLLTKFFDVVRTEDNQKDYDKIVEIMRNAENINYNQVDDNGISVIEKIINSENLETLDLVKDCEFNYSREMDFAFENISNPKFKRKVKNLNVKFPNIEEAVRLNSQAALQSMMYVFKSPFCDVANVMDDLFGKTALVNYYNILSLLDANGVDISKVRYQ